MRADHDCMAAWGDCYECYEQERREAAVRFANRAAWNLSPCEVVEAAKDEGFDLYEVVVAFRAAGFKERDLHAIIDAAGEHGMRVSRSALALARGGAK